MASYDMVYDDSMEEEVQASSEIPAEEAIPATAGEPPAEVPETEAPETETPAAEPEEQPESSIDCDRYLEQKYICKSVDANGYNMDASTLGAEYSVIFHENGMANFVLAGTNVPELAWTQGKIQTETGEADTFSIEYMDGTTWNFVITEAGLDLDFYGSMLMHFEPEA